MKTKICLMEAQMRKLCQFKIKSTQVLDQLEMLMIKWNTLTDLVSIRRVESVWVTYQ